MRTKTIQPEASKRNLASQPGRTQAEDDDRGYLDEGNVEFVPTPTTFDPTRAQFTEPPQERERQIALQERIAETTVLQHFRGWDHAEALLAVIPGLVPTAPKHFRFAFGAMRGHGRIRLDADDLLELALYHVNAKGRKVQWSVELPRAFAMGMQLPRANGQDYSPAVLRWSQREMLDRAGVRPFKRPEPRLPKLNVAATAAIAHNALCLPLLRLIVRQVQAESLRWHKERGRAEIAVPCSVDWAYAAMAIPSELQRRPARYLKRKLRAARKALLRAVLMRHGKRRQSYRYSIKALRADDPGLTLEELEMRVLRMLKRCAG